LIRAVANAFEVVLCCCAEIIYNSFEGIEIESVKGRKEGKAQSKAH
jgi:hypothetical protein